MNTTAQPVHVATPPMATLDQPRCEFTFADGRRCAMRRWEAHPSLCISHAHASPGAGSACSPRKSKPEEHGQSLDIDLAPVSGEFTTAFEVNRALGKVFLLLALNRIPRRNAVALGYIGQLLLQSLPAVREEIIAVCGRESWQETLQSAVCEEEDNLEEETNNDQAGSTAENKPEDENDRVESAGHHTEETAAPDPAPWERQSPHWRVWAVRAAHVKKVWAVLAAHVNPSQILKRRRNRTSQRATPPLSFRPNAPRHQPT